MSHRVTKFVKRFFIHLLLLVSFAVSAETNDICLGEHDSNLPEKKIVFVESNSTLDEGITYAKKLGFSPILFTRLREHNPKVYKELDLSNFSAVYNVDTLDSGAMYSLIKDLKLTVGAIVTSYDDTVLPTAKVAQKLGLPHPNLQGLESAYRKDQVRKILANNNIKQPRYQVVPIRTASKHRPNIPYPFVVKPVRDSGAKGAYLCRNEKEYQEAVNKIQNINISWLGVKKDDLLLEEFIEGPQYGADLLWNNGKWNVLGIGKVFIDPNKSLCSLGMSFPSDLSPDVLPSVEKQIIKWVEFVGLKGGALCVDFKFCNNAPYLIEINPRVGGIIERIKLALGISPVEYVIHEACGQEKRLDVTQLIPKTYVANAFIFPKKSGTLYEVKLPSKDLKDFIIMYNFKKLPTEIDCGDRNLGKVVGHVITTGTSVSDAMNNASNMANEIELKVK